MAIKQTTTITSDISGDEEAQTFTYAISGVSYEIDLTDAEIDEFHDAIATFVGHSRKVSGKVAGGRKASASTSAKRDDLDDIRAWANAKADAGEENFRVAARGRIKSDIIAAYDAK